MIRTTIHNTKCTTTKFNRHNWDGISPVWTWDVDCLGIPRPRVKKERIPDTVIEINAEASRKLQRKSLSSYSNKERFNRFRRYFMKRRINVDCITSMRDIVDVADYESLISLPPNAREHAKRVEDVLLLIFGLYSSTSKWHIVLSITTFVKCWTGNSLLFLIGDSFLMSMIDKYLKVQQLQSASEARRMFENYQDFKKSETFRKVYELAIQVIGYANFGEEKLKSKNELFNLLQSEAQKRCVNKLSLIETVLDTITFFGEKIAICIETGNIWNFVHTRREYADWFEENRRISSLFPHITALEEHGTNIYSYLSDLDKCVEKGQEMVKFIDKKHPDKLFLMKEVSKLQNFQTELRTKRAALRTRRQPFGVLLSGASSIGKSYLTRVIFNYYCSLFDLDNSDDKIYTRTVGDEYWSNFQSYQHTIVFDDVVYSKPDKVMGMDPTINELIQVLNTQPFVPAQADLADKGRTPVRPELVIATTNKMDLWSNVYFTAPVALNRRFPFTVSAVPKKEYSSNGMLKADFSDECLSDYWNFNVYRIQPTSNDRPNFVLVEKFEGDGAMERFLAFFGKSAMQFREDQKKTETKMNDLKNLTTCKVCYKVKGCSCQQLQSLDRGVWSRWFRTWHTQPQPSGGDGQALEVEYGRWWRAREKFLANMTWFVFLMFVIYVKFHSVVPRRIATLLNVIVPYEWISQFVAGYVYTMAAKRIMEYAAAFHCCLWAKYPRIFETVSVVAKYGSILISVHMVYKLFAQNMQSGEKPVIVERDERENVWYCNHYTVTDFDISDMSRSYASLSLEQVEKILYRNCVSLDIRKPQIGKGTLNKAFCVGGHYYVSNAHAFNKELDIFEVDVIQGISADGVNRSKTILLSRSDIKYIDGTDLVILKIIDIPPKKDLRSLFARGSLRGKHQCTYLGRTHDGLKYTNTVNKVVFDSNLWCGVSKDATKKGDCGSILYTRESGHVVILGIHTSSNILHQVNATPVFWELLKDLPIIDTQGPRLQSEDIDVEVESLHYKSPIRYIESGSADVHGSHRGFRVAHKSAVCDTPLRKFLEERGFSTDCAAPVMKGWQPWRNALVPMLSTKNLLVSSILDKAFDDYLSQIVNELPINWQQFVQVYDMETVLNGYPGVKYVDAINKSSSAGFPWRRSKKHFLVSAPSELYPEGVALNDEMTERVSHILQLYKSGTRYAPVFSACLKDEALPLRKVETGKTRVFTAAPMDWTIVVRQYCLSFCRLIQKHKEPFECAVGTNCQSKEWGDWHNYLAKFPLDRVVAGDYGKFDKSMSSKIIMAAFDILKELAIRAGWSAEDLRVLSCIAEDTSYPLVDYNGDFITFYGSNPSGHPLTVIINSLVNSLYLRYAYILLSMEHGVPLRPFRECVRAVTYGDDNLMTVSEECTWFDHTKLQKCLAIHGIEYTMADKESISVPFITLGEASFLKRQWVYDVEVGNYLAPLDKASISKMLLVWVRSKHVSEKEQLSSILRSAIGEMFFHGREEYERFSLLVMEMRELFSLQLWLPPPEPFEVLVQQFKDN